MEHLDCVNAADGKSLWRASFATRYAGGIDPDEGPRCVPVVHDGKVFVYGVGRDVHAVSVEDGRKIWSRELKSDYGAEDGYFGAGSTPLVLQDRLIVCVGGGKQSGVVALDLATGETLWQALDSEASYASPVAIKVAGRECLLAVMRLEAYLLDPSNGAEINRVRFGARGPTVNAATPIVDGAEAFLTASYGIGCRKLDFAAQQVANAWLDDEVISSQYVTPVRVGDFLYGITGREDMRNAGLICVDWKAGKVQWRQADYGTAHLIAAGDRLLVQSVAGKLEVLAADPQSYRVLSSARLPVGVYRALPALADGIYFGRRTISATEGEIVAVRVGQKSQ
jgi:hypothetical protein